METQAVSKGNSEDWISLALLSDNKKKPDVKKKITNSLGLYLQQVSTEKTDSGLMVYLEALAATFPRTTRHVPSFPNEVSLPPDVTSIFQEIYNKFPDITLQVADRFIPCHKSGIHPSLLSPSSPPRSSSQL